MKRVYQAPSTVETWQPGMFERPCGGCTMCCKVPAIPEIGKAPGAWCEHCEKGLGCRIYDRRPEPCQGFHCLWKVMPDFPEELRPDKCKVIWTMSEDGDVAIATTEYPRALQTRRQKALVRNFRCLGIAVVIRGRLGQPADRMAAGAFGVG